jgi:hypothetical protein
MKHLKEYESSSQFLNEILYNNLSYYITSFQKDQRFLHYRLLKENTSSSSSSASAVASSTASSLPVSITNQTASSTLASSVISSSTSGTMIVNSLFYLNSLKKFLISLFELHGAVEYSNQFLELKTSTSEYTYYSSQSHSGMTGSSGGGGGGGGTSQPSSSSSSASLSSLPSSISSPYCEYIDNNGQVILLPSNLITSFARFAAFSNLSFSQRYSIEKIYLKNSKRGTHSSSNKQHQLSLSALSCQQPDVIHEAIYDMIVPANGTIQSILIEFEILSVALSFLSSFSALLPNFLLRLGHPFLTEGIVGVCCIDYTKETSLGNTLEDCQFKIKKILSLFHEILDEKELSDYIKEQSLPVNQANKIFIFCRNLLLQRNSSSSSASSFASASDGTCSPLLELQQIEKVS